MEKSEPTLVPEWLRSTGSITGGGSSAHHHVASSSLHSDVSSSALLTRNRSSRSINDKDSVRSAFLDRSSSSNSRRILNNSSSVKHPYSSFTRSHRDKNRDKEKDRSGTGDIWDHDSSDALENILTSRAEKNSLRRSQSMVSRKPGEFLPRKLEDLKQGLSGLQTTGNGVVAGATNHISLPKTSFEKDFPSLGVEEKQGIGRVSSPVLSTAVQSLPIVNSGLLGGEKWTSALAEVPPIISTNGMGNPSVQQSVITPSSGASSVTTGLNMAEALSQVPTKVRAAPQLPDKTQRLEELAIKQSRQLIPVTPSMPKALVPASSDKSKQPRPVTRTSDVSVATKVVQQPYTSQLTNQVRSGQVRSDAPSVLHGGKFLVLKPTRENGIPLGTKESSSPTKNNSSSKVINGQPAGFSLNPTALANPKVSALETKVANLALNSRSAAEKRAALSQAQSRNDFFNLMRKKTSNNASAITPDLSSPISSTSIDKSITLSKESGSSSEGTLVDSSSIEMASNGNSHDTHEKCQTVTSNLLSDGEKNLCLNGAVYPDEEEAAFLRSLGWEENTEEDEGLTEEEINAFYREYWKVKPTLKVLRGTLPKCLMLSDLPASNSGGSSSE